MKAALLGLSHPHSGILLTTLENLPEVTSVCLWDPDAVALAHPNLPPARKVSHVSTNLDAVLAQRDLVFAILCVRHDQAAALARRILAAGKHLVAEKPAGLNSAEIVVVRGAAASAGVVASVLYPRRFHPCVIAAKSLMRSGVIGPLFSAECRFLATQIKFRDPQSWLFRRDQAGGGILLWLGCHCLDLLHHVTGDAIVEVGAAIAIRSGETIDVEDTAALTLKFRSGAIGTFHAGYTLAFSGQGYLNAAGYDSYLGFNGRSGRIVWPYLEPRLLVEHAREDGTAPMREEGFATVPSTSYGGGAGEEFFRRFIAAIQGEGLPPTTMDDAIRTARIIEAAEESSSSGRIIRITPPDSSNPPPRILPAA